MLNYDAVYYSKEIVLRSQNKEYECSVCLKGMDLKPDCQVGHFGYNFYFRTPYGIHRKKYSSAKKMEIAIEKVARNQGFEIVRWTRKED